MNPLRFLLLLALVAAPGFLAAQAPSIVAGFQPNRIVLGQNAAFIIELEGNPRIDSVEPPTVDGLRLTSAGTGTQRSMEIINGRVTQRQSLSIRFVAQPSRAGVFEIPAFTIRVDGRSLEVPASRLEVLPPSGAGPDATLDDIYSLEVVLPERPLWVGEDLPITARLRIDGAIELGGLGNFVLDGDDFGNVRLAGEVHRSAETGGGNPRRRLDIPLRLVPLKSGRLPLRISVVAEMAFPRSGHRTPDPWGSLPSLFRDYERREIESNPIEVEVRALPTPAPAGFSGGIGRFAARMELQPASVQVGEPLTVTLTVTGEGSFDRLQAPAFTEDPRWRIYEPRAEFTAAERLGHRGTKTFTYTLIPLDAAVTSLPALPFSSFDPESGSYVDLPLPSLAITVRPAPDRPAPPPVVAAPATPGIVPGNELLPDVANPGPFVGSITPDFLSPATWLHYGWPGAVLLLGVLVSLIRRRITDPARRDRAAFRARLHSVLNRARQAARNNDSAAFHPAAVEVLRLLVGRQLGRDASSLTGPEVEAGLARLGLAADLHERARRLLTSADLLHYGGAAALPPVDLNAALQDLESLARRQ